MITIFPPMYADGYAPTMEADGVLPNDGYNRHMVSKMQAVRKWQMKNMIRKMKGREHDQ